MSLINDALKQAGKTQRDRAPQAKLSTPLQPVDTLNKPASGLGVTRYLIPLALLLVLGLGTLFLLGWWRARNSTEQTRTAQLNQPVAASAARPDDVVIARPAPPASSIKINTNLVTRPSLAAKVEPPPVVISAPPPPVVSAPVLPAKIAAPGTVDKTIEAAPAPALVKPTVAAKTPEPIRAAPAPISVAKAPEPAPAPVVASAPAVPAPAPAAPAPTAKVEFPDLKMQGIFFRVSNPSVLINGRTVFVGDEVQDVKVVSIDRNSIRVQKGSEFKVYRLH